MNKHQYVLHLEVGERLTDDKWVHRKASITCVDVEEVISGHAWFAWHTSRNDDQMAVVQSIGQLLRSKMTGDLHSQLTFYNSSCCRLYQTHSCKMYVASLCCEQGKHLGL